MSERWKGGKKGGVWLGGTKMAIAKQTRCGVVRRNPALVICPWTNCFRRQIEQARVKCVQTVGCSSEDCTSQLLVRMIKHQQRAAHLLIITNRRLFKNNRTRNFFFFWMIEYFSGFFSWVNLFITRKISLNFLLFFFSSFMPTIY